MVAAVVEEIVVDMAWECREDVAVAVVAAVVLGVAAAEAAAAAAQGGA